MWRPVNQPHVPVYLPPTPAFSLSITSNHAISPATLPFASWQPSVCVHHTSCLSCLLPCIIYQIALCPSASQLLLINPRIAATFFLFFPSYFSLSPSIHLSFRLSPPPPSSNAGFPLHISRTLVTAFSASSCLLSPACCSISSIMYLHAHSPPFFSHSSFHLSPSFSPSTSRFHFVLPVLCPFCPKYLRYLSP